MTCANCGKEIAAGVRYCIHCGAEQAVPTPIAAVAAALMTRGNEREAANAAHAESVSGRSGGSDPLRSHDTASPAASARRGVVAANAEPPRPVYANGPRGRTVAVTLVGCCAIVAIAVAAVLTWRMEKEPAATSVFEPGQHAPAGTSTAPAAGEVRAPGETTTIATPGPSPAGEAPATSDEGGALPANADTASGANPPVEIKPLPRTHAPRPSHATAPGATPPATRGEPAPPPAVAMPAPAKPNIAAAAPGTAHVADRWQRLDEELSRCTREDFITRVICGQRARFRYCDGYWGKVPACPGSPSSERGQ